MTKSIKLFAASLLLATLGAGHALADTPAPAPDDAPAADDVTGLAEAIPYIGLGAETADRAYYEARAEGDPNATLYELDDAIWALEEARERLLAGAR